MMKMIYIWFGIKEEQSRGKGTHWISTQIYIHNIQLIIISPKL